MASHFEINNDGVHHQDDIGTPFRFGWGRSPIMQWGMHKEVRWMGEQLIEVIRVSLGMDVGTGLIGEENK